MTNRELPKKKANIRKFLIKKGVEIKQYTKANKHIGEINFFDDNLGVGFAYKIADKSKIKVFDKLMKKGIKLYVDCEKRVEFIKENYGSKNDPKV